MQKEDKKTLSKKTAANNRMPIVLYKSLRDPKTNKWSMALMSADTQKIAGFSHEKFEQDPLFWGSRLYPEDAKKVWEKFKQITAGEIDSLEVNYRWLHKDATYHWYMDHAVLIRNKDGEPTELVGSWVDISDYEKIGQDMKDNEEHYKKIVELSPHGLFVQSDLKFHFLNRAAVKLFGAKSADEIIGKSLLEFIHPDYHELARIRTEKIVTEKKSMPLVEYKIITLDGEVKDVEIASTPFIYQGKTAAQGVIVDVTKYKQSENILKENADELEQLNKLLLKRAFANTEREKVPEQCDVYFNAERSVLVVGGREIKIQKFSKQYYMLDVIFKNEKDAAQDWQFSEISELMDNEAEFDWKKLYNISDAVRKKIAIETGIKDFFFLNTQSLKVNPKYTYKKS